MLFSKKLNALVLIVPSLLVTQVCGHGAMQFPVTRNVHTSHYCPQCANGPSVCGSGGNSQWPADDSKAGLLNGVYTTPLTQLIAGGMVEVEAFFTAAHMGHFALELCSSPGPEISEECFIKLERDPNDTRYAAYADSAPWASILPVNECTTTCSSSKPLRVRYKIPNTLSDHAVLRWYWQTGNSCDSLSEVQTSNAPASVSSWSATINGKSCRAALTNGGRLCGTDCPNTSCANEQFKNCADVQIISGDVNTIVTSANAGISTGGGSGSDAGSGSGNGNGSGSGSGSSGGSGNGSGAGSGSGSGNGSGSGSGNGSGSGSGSADVTACKSAVGSNNPAWDEDCKNKCDFYATNPMYCKQGSIIECVKAIGYCG